MALTLETLAQDVGQAPVCEPWHPTQAACGPVLSASMAGLRKHGTSVHSVCVITKVRTKLQVELLAIWSHCHFINV